jgi:hypothetical protein
MFDKLVLCIKTILLTELLVSSIYFSAAFAQTTKEPASTVSASSSVVATQPPSQSRNWHAREGMRFQRNWGVDIVGVRPVSSGFMLNFRYRVVDPEKAKLLNDKRSKAYLVDEATGNILGVPIMENLGELRQKVAPEPNRTYFIMFGNPGKLVKSGSRVSVVIGDFRVDNLVVD